VERLSDVSTADCRRTGEASQLQVALDSMPGALAYTDESLSFVFCNDRFKEMYRVLQELLQPGRPYAI
jgi:PAS domain-containing protein